MELRFNEEKTDQTQDHLWAELGFKDDLETEINSFSVGLSTIFTSSCASAAYCGTKMTCPGICNNRWQE